MTRKRHYTKGVRWSRHKFLPLRGPWPTLSVVDHQAECTRALVAVEPRRPPTTNEGSQTSFRHDHCKHLQKSKHQQRSVDAIKLLSILNYIDLHAWRHGLRPKRNHFRGQSSRRALNLDMLDAGQSPNADSPQGII